MTSDTRRAALAHPDIIEIWGRTVQGMTRPFRCGTDLVAGLSFGSRIATHTREFEPSLLMQCDEQFRRDLVAFDWWVRNADRTLGVLSGNPNLLWDPKAEAPVVIDHNMAFDCDFDAEQFLQTHVFRAVLNRIHHPGFWPRFPDPTRPAHVT